MQNVAIKLQLKSYFVTIKGTKQEHKGQKLSTTLERLNELQAELEDFSGLTPKELLDHVPFNTLIKIHILDFIMETPSLRKEFESRALYFEKLKENDLVDKVIENQIKLTQTLFALISPEDFTNKKQDKDFMDYLSGQHAIIFGLRLEERQNLSPESFAQKFLDIKSFKIFNEVKANAGEVLGQLSKSCAFVVSIRSTFPLFISDINKFETLFDTWGEGYSNLVDALEFLPQKKYVYEFRNLYRYCLSLRNLPFGLNSAHFKYTTEKLQIAETKEPIIGHCADRVLKELKRHYLKAGKVKLEVYLRQSKISFEGQEINLSPVEMDIFKAFAQKPLERLSLRSLNPYKDNLNYENTLRSYISKLRKKLPEDLIKNQHNSGYYLNLKADEIVIK